MGSGSNSALNTILLGISNYPHQHQNSPSGQPQLDDSYRRRKLPTEIKTLLLTLHFFFPHDLLPALNLLDRKLLTRLYGKKTEKENNDDDDDSANNSRWREESENDVEVWYVQSASAAGDESVQHLSTNTNSKRNKYRNFGRGPSQTQYEVRLDSWNCSCAGFAFKAFQQLLLSGGSASHTGSSGTGSTMTTTNATQTSKTVLFGGSTLPSQVIGGGIDSGTDNTGGTGGIPICKHIIAVTLASAAPQLFGDSVSSKETTVEELAGRAVGWDDYA